MSDTEYVPSFYISHLAWYADSLRRINQGEPEIMVCNRHPEGGVEFEFSIRWYDHGSSRPPAMRVEIFYDGFAAFTLEPFASMLDGLPTLGENPSAVVVANYLRARGFIDCTQYVDPDATPEQVEQRSAAEKTIAELEGALRIARKSVVPRDRA